MDPKDQNQTQPHSGLVYNDIHNTDIRDLVAEHNEWEEGAWEDGQPEVKPQAPAPTPEPEAKQIEQPIQQAAPTPEPTPTPTPQPVKTEEPVKPALDEDALSEKMVQKLYDKLNPQTVEEKKDFAAKLKELNEKAKAENREPTYEEALALLGEEVKGSTKQELKEELKKEILEDLNREVTEEEQRVQQEQEQRAKATEESQKTLYTEWDRQLGILINQGSIPKVLNDKDENDPGMVAQKRLFEAVNQIAAEQQKAGKPVSLNLVEAFMSPEYKALMSQPGKDAPVNGARKSVSGDSRASLNYYKDIHGADPRDIISELYEAE